MADQPGLTEKFGTVSKKAKKLFAVICAAAVVGAGIPAVVFSVGAQSDIVASTTAYLNLRTGAGMNYSAIKVIPKGENVSVVDRSDAEWLKVRLQDGTEGYLYSEYLDIVTDGTTNAYLNLRKSADTSSRVIKTLAPDTGLDIVSFCGSNWAYVKTSDGSSGYVCTDYVDFGTKTRQVEAPDAMLTSSSKTSDSSSEVTMTISTKARKLAVGNYCTLTAKTSSGGSIEWKSLNKNIASVDSNGKVHGEKSGTAVVYARDKRTNQTVTCTLTVVKTEINLINLPTRVLTLEAGKTYDIKASTTPEKKESLIKYRSENTDVATVNSAGRIKAVGAGTVWVTCYDPTDTVTASIKVTVTKKSGRKYHNCKNYHNNSAESCSDNKYFTVICFYRTGF